MKISSVGKKVGIAAGVAAAAAVTTLAYVKGKQNLEGVDKFVNSKGAQKVGLALAEGFKGIGRNLQLAFAKLKTKLIREGALTDKDINKLREVEAREIFSGINK